MECPSCKKQTPDISVFCIHCGANLNIPEERGGITQSPPPSALSIITKANIDEENATDQEWHPWLKLFTIMGMLAGVVFAGPGLVSLLGIRYFNLDGFLSLLISILPGVLLIWAGVHTLKATDFFRKWKCGVKKIDKRIANITIYFGVLMTIALFFVAPFMRFITDAVGGGLGVNRRD